MVDMVSLLFFGHLYLLSRTFFSSLKMFFFLRPECPFTEVSGQGVFRGLQESPRKHPKMPQKTHKSPI